MHVKTTRKKIKSVETRAKCIDVYARESNDVSVIKTLYVQEMTVTFMTRGIIPKGVINHRGSEKGNSYQTDLNLRFFLCSSHTT